MQALIIFHRRILKFLFKYSTWKLVSCWVSADSLRRYEAAPEWSAGAWVINICQEAIFHPGTKRERLWPRGAREQRVRSCSFPAAERLESDQETICTLRIPFQGAGGCVCPSSCLFGRNTHEPALKAAVKPSSFSFHAHPQILRR